MMGERAGIALLLRLFALVCLLCVYTAVWIAPAGAVGKTTVDPNTPEAAAKAPADEGFWTADKRLAKQVTFEAQRDTVSSILADLGEMTGVKLTSGLSSQDWQVRDRKMIIFAKDMPLRDLMQSIARVMKFKWSRTKPDGVYTYRLFMDRKSVLEAEAQAYREEERFNREQRQKREALADKLGELAVASSADLAALKKNNPMLYAMSASGLAGSLGELFGYAPEMRDAFLSGTEMRLSVTDLPEQTRNAMLGIAQSISRMSLRPSDSEPSADQLAQNPGMLTEISVQPPTRGGEGSAESFVSRFTLAQVDFKYKRADSNESESEFGFPIFDPDSSFGKSIAGLLVAALEDRPPDMANGWSVSVDPNEIRLGDFGEPLVEHDKSAEIEGELDFSVSDKDKNKDPRTLESLAYQLGKLAESTGLNVVSDTYGDTNSVTVRDKIAADRFLQGLEIMPSCNWWKRGSTIELRDRHWFRKRSLQIPEAWLVKWRETFKTTGTLDIDDLANIAVLLDEPGRYEMNVTGDDVLDNGSMRWAYRQSLAFLKFYATLTSAQREALYSKAGLDLSTLTADQKQSAAEQWSWWDGKSPAAITGTRTRNDKQWTYRFLTPNGGTAAWVNTPSYEPPRAKIESAPAK